MAVPGSGERDGWKGRESREEPSRLSLCWWRIVTSTSMDAVCSAHVLQGKMLGDVAVKGWAAVLVSARAELIFFTENRALYKLL